MIVNNEQTGLENEQERGIVDQLHAARLEIKEALDAHEVEDHNTLWHILLSEAHTKLLRALKELRKVKE